LEELRLCIELGLVYGAVQLGGVVVWLGALRASRVWKESLNEAWCSMWLEAGGGLIWLEVWRSSGFWRKKWHWRWDGPVVKTCHLHRHIHM